MILVNLSDNEFVVEHGMRICQLVLAKYEQIEWEEVAALGASDRGEGGFGHTGL